MNSGWIETPLKKRGCSPDFYRIETRGGDLPSQFSTLYRIFRCGFRGRTGLNLVVKRIYRFIREKVVLAPFCIVESVAVDQHHKSLHFDIADLLGKDRKAFALQFAVCHHHVKHLPQTLLDSPREPMQSTWPSSKCRYQS